MCSNDRYRTLIRTFYQAQHCQLQRPTATACLFADSFGTRRRIPAAGAGWGLMLWRSGAERADCPAVLGPGSHRATRCAPCGRSAQTGAMSQIWKRAARADPEPAFLGAPEIAPSLRRRPGCGGGGAVKAGTPAGGRPLPSNRVFGEACVAQYDEGADARRGLPGLSRRGVGSQRKIEIAFRGLHQSSAPEMLHCSDFASRLVPSIHEPKRRT